MKSSRIPVWVIDLLLGVLFVLLAATFMALLPGCGAVKSYLKPPPVEAQCDAKCYVSCTPTPEDTGIRWDGSPVDAGMWDVLGGDVVPSLTEKLRQCEVSRKACQQCLDRLKAKEIIR